MTIRLLEVAVDLVAARWRWRVMHGTDVIAYGFEASRGTAQHAGDLRSSNCCRTEIPSNDGEERNVQEA